jgi:hypothetical protein
MRAEEACPRPKHRQCQCAATEFIAYSQRGDDSYDAKATVVFI